VVSSILNLNCSKSLIYYSPKIFFLSTASLTPNSKTLFNHVNSYSCGSLKNIKTPFGGQLDDGIKEK